jgi:hypothetical protein
MDVREFPLREDVGVTVNVMSAVSASAQMPAAQRSFANAPTHA